MRPLAIALLTILAACQGTPELQEQSLQASSRAAAPAPVPVHPASRESLTLSDAAGNGAQAPGIPEPIPSPDVQPQPADSAKIILNGSLSLEVENATRVEDTIRGITQRAGGYIASTYANNRIEPIPYPEDQPDRGTRTITLTLRLPARTFNQSLSAIERTGDYVLDRSLSSQDVTTQFIDNRARLQARQALEKRLLELLAKAARVQEIIQVEAQLSNVRAEIESLQGQLRYLGNQVAYSTLTVNLVQHTDRPTPPGNRFTVRLKAAFRQSFQTLQDVFLGLIRYLPSIALLLLTIWVIVRLTRRFRRRNRVQHPNA